MRALLVVGCVAASLAPAAASAQAAGPAPPEATAHAGRREATQYAERPLELGLTFGVGLPGGVVAAEAAWHALPHLAFAAAVGGNAAGPQGALAIRAQEAWQRSATGFALGVSAGPLVREVPGPLEIDLDYEGFSGRFVSPLVWWLNAELYHSVRIEQVLAMRVILGWAFPLAKGDVRCEADPDEPPCDDPSPEVEAPLEPYFGTLYLGLGAAFAL